VHLTITSEGPLVGRAGELQRLEEELERAAAGRARPVIVRGEAGVGKTRLIAELIDRNAERVTALAVSCSERMSAPYVPIARLLEQLALCTEARMAQRLERIVRRLTQLPEESSSDEDGAVALGSRVRLIMDVVRAVNEALVGRLFVCVIEDIHWADRDTHDVLEALCDGLFAPARSLSLLLVLTERTADPGSRGEGIGTRLERRAHASSLFLKSLDELEIDQLIRHRGIERPSRRLVSTLFTLSSGNPLYVGESLRRIDELNGFVEAAGAIETTISAAELGPPADVLDLVRRRVDLLSEDVVEVLTVAAIIGDDIEPDLLERITKRRVHVAMEAAVTAGFLVESTDGFRFSHPLVRRALSDRLGRDRRQRLHRRVVDGLLAYPSEQHASRASEIAYHLVEGGLVDVNESTMVFLWLAGRHTYGIGAWADAARFFDAGVTVGERLEADPTFLAWMKFGSGRAHDQNYDFVPALARYSEVAELARSLGETELWGRIVLADVRLRDLHRSTASAPPTDVRALDDVLSHIDETRPRLRSRLLAQYCTIEMSRGRAENGFAHGEEAARIALLAGDPAAIATAESTLGMALMSVGSASEAARRLGRARNSLVEARRPDLEGITLGRLALTKLMLGDLPAALDLAGGAREAYASVGDRKGECLVETIFVALATLRGDFAAAEDHSRQAEARLRLSQDWFAPIVLYPALADGRSSQADDIGADAAVDAWKATGQGGRAPARLLVATRAGRLDQARTLLSSERVLLELAAFASMFGTGITAVLAEVARRLGRLDLVAPLLAALDRRHDQFVVLSPGWGTTCSRTRGMLLALAGETEAAALQLRYTVESTEGMGALPELARAHLDLGLLLREVPRAVDGDAHEHLSVAAGLFEQLGMPRLLDDAEDALGGGTSATGNVVEPRAKRDRKVLMLTDVVESTRISVAAGDEAYLQLIEDHDAIVRRQLRNCGGVEVNSTGDGILAWFRSPDAALNCAFAIRSDVQVRNDSTQRAPLAVRIGLAIGRPIERDGRLYGAAVNLTARLCAAAPPGDTLVDADLCREATGAVRFEALGPLELKGFSAPVPAYVAHEAGDMAARQR
jgi:class 3 adenylate cyclase